MFAKKVVIAGCVRDCESALSRVLQNIKNVASLYAESAFVFVENDSKDSTKRILQEWRDNNPNTQLITLDGLDNSEPVRSVRLEVARNAYLSAVRTSYRDYDHLVVLDCDEVNAGEFDLRAFYDAIEFLDSESNISGIFANQSGLYYDLWALRHPKQCPGDVWEEVYDCEARDQLSQEDAYNKVFSKRAFTLFLSAEPVEVYSAFGGLGIYKMKSLLTNKRNYIGQKQKLSQPTDGFQQDPRPVCEHVEFNIGFIEQGERLFILPYLLNCSALVIQHSQSFSHYMSLNGLFPSHLQNDGEPFKLRRNSPCPCGSGMKYKNCHGILS